MYLAEKNLSGSDHRFYGQEKYMEVLEKSIDG